MIADREFDRATGEMTELRISKKALDHNLKVFEDLLLPSTKIMLIIKADAYGHGAKLIAQQYENNERIGYFATTYIHEGIELRENGIHKPILILNPDPAAFDVMVEHCLEPEIHNFELLNAFIAYLKNNKTEGSPYPIHLKFNTGMNRLGFEKSQLPDLTELMNSQNSVATKSIMTHLSSAHAAEEDDYSRMQLSLFDEIIEKSKSIQNENTFFHALNSSGIFRFPNNQYQMVRLGIGFYGNSSIADLKLKLKSPLSFISKVCDVRKVEKGASISYSRSGRASKDTQIATLALGYADGFNRLLSNGNWEVEINGQLFPTIGNICMGLSMLDIGDAKVNVGDEAIIFGGINSIYDYAEELQTITYEVMCSIGPRVSRQITE